MYARHSQLFTDAVHDGVVTRTRARNGGRLEFSFMRIVSLNAWGGARYEAMMAWIPTVDADVLCLQEVTRTPGLMGWSNFEDGIRTLPQRADLLADVAMVLPGHDAWFAVSDTGPVSDRDRKSHRQQFGIGLFARTTLARVATRTGFVHGRYVEHRVWPDSERPRAAQVARFYDHHASRFITVGHLHGLRDGSAKADTPARRKQAERLATLVDGIREPQDLTIVCGDLNLLPTSETFKILADIGLTDLVGDADTRTALYTKPVRHASYLLVSDPGAVKRFEILDSPEVSDHRPLLLEI